MTISDEMSDTCEVCDGSGEYPIHDKFGGYVLTINCPACYGDGLTDDAREAKVDREGWQRRYDLAMADKRARLASLRPEVRK